MMVLAEVFFRYGLTAAYIGGIAEMIFRYSFFFAVWQAAEDR